jgi:proline iminopeptidase
MPLHPTSFATPPQRPALYPPLNPYDTGFLKVGDIHTLYYEQSGNPEGVPVVFLHGGPGSGSNPKHRQFFDPQHYRIIVFDQRGAGQSTPLGELRQNTPQYLIADIEQLRNHLKVNRWHVFGGSWGSTLALSYAIEHPGRVLSLTLRGIFLMRQKEIHWFLYGMKSIFPEAWLDFVEPLPAAGRDDILNAYHKLLTHPDKNVHLPAAKRWSAYETACVRLLPVRAEIEGEGMEDDDHAYAISRIECHYFVHNKFVPDNYLIANIRKIRHIPAVIVQGRYDVVCPVETAYELHQSWPEAQFIIVQDAGHSASEPGISSELTAATNAFRAIPR